MNLVVNRQEKVSSLDLLKEINFWREKESEQGEKIRADLRHDNLLSIIRDEFEHEISLLKIKESKYKNDRGREYPCFYLTLNQSKQILLKESKFVRRMIIKYIEKLETIIAEKNSTEWLQDRKNGKMTRRKETDAIQDRLIPLAIEQGSKNYKMFYSNYTKLIHKTVGIESGMREKCNRDALRYIEFLESTVENAITEEVNKGTYYKDIYQICKTKCNQLKEIVKPPKQKYLDCDDQLLLD